MIMFWSSAAAHALSISILLSLAGANLYEQLRHYEVLEPSDLHPKRTKRSADHRLDHTREYNFKALGRDFHIFLQRRTYMPTIMNGFEVATVNERGKEHVIPVHLHDFYEGHLVDDQKSWVQARLDGKEFSAWIEVENETYVVEPAAGHLPNVTDEKVIIYRDSDLKYPKKHRYCGLVRADDGVTETVENTSISGAPAANLSTKSSETLHRSRRATSPHFDTCPLLLVADYRFFTKIGKSSIAKTSRILIELIDRINRIYRRSHFTDAKQRVLQGYGFGIKRINIHNSWYVGAEKNHYNRMPKSSKDIWSDRDLLSAFDRDDYSDYCLAHLFTYQKFGAGTLGLAYIASDRSGALGGVCSPKQHCQSKYCSINTGWTTFQDSAGAKLITLESHLVTAHELGHNFGSSHDPDTPECSPPPEKDGKYLMYQYSVSGYEKNNRYFSPCSRRAIGRVLQKKAGSCFVMREKSFCGNNRQEGDEECDAGYEGLLGKDPCCTANCKLKSGKQCSPLNHACCTQECMVAPANVICADSDLTSPCEGESKCDGKTIKCPTPRPLDGAKCGVHGICKNRTCITYCERQDMIPCQCDKVEDACYMCCRKTVNATCQRVKKHITPPLILKDGLPCIQGVCRKGKCEKINISIERFWNFIKYGDVNEIGRFIWANVVGFIIIVSGVIWCILSCVVSHFDRKRIESATGNPHA